MDTKIKVIFKINEIEGIFGYANIVEQFDDDNIKVIGTGKLEKGFIVDHSDGLIGTRLEIGQDIREKPETPLLDVLNNTFPKMYKEFEVVEGSEYWNGIITTK